MTKRFALLGWLLLTACGGGDDGSAVNWECWETGDSCGCIDVCPNCVRSFSSSAQMVLACGAYPCCLIDDVEGVCECAMQTNCEAEADSMPGTSVVESCPPPGEVDFSQCAAEGLNCRDDYLQSEGLLGCCPGLLCSKNVDDVPVCADASTVTGGGNAGAEEQCTPGSVAECHCPDGSLSIMRCVDIDGVGRLDACECSGS